MKITNRFIPTPVLQAWALDDGDWKIVPFGNGLINHTWKLEKGGNALILQRINHDVFRNPSDIAHNMKMMDDYLKQNHPDYLFVATIPTQQGEPMKYVAGHGYYRVFPFVQNSRTIDVVKTPEQAFEAARQFGRFTRLLSGLDSSALRPTIPGFHDLTIRYQQFLKAVQSGDQQRIRESNNMIQKLVAFSDIVTRFEGLRHNPAFRLRVIHHDTKISNVLFDNNDHSLCVIDLDTVMPGYFISDLGDMMRTYLCPVSEEEKYTDRVVVRGNFYRAIIDGYLSEMQSELTGDELKHLFYSGQFMIYMQALRFLTDHLQNDMYYGAAYPGHNFNRARNQLTLLERLTENEAAWSREK